MPVLVGAHLTKGERTGCDLWFAIWVMAPLSHSQTRARLVARGPFRAGGDGHRHPRAIRLSARDPVSLTRANNSTMVGVCDPQ